MFDFLKIKMIGILGISLFLASPVFAKPMKQDLSLTVGVYHDVDVSHPPIPKGFSVGGTYKKITKLRYYPKKKKLRFIPKKRGVGTVSIEDKSGSLIYEFKIDIRHTSLHQIKREIAQLLQDVDGINIKILNQKVIIDGKVMLPKEIGRIHSVTKQYKGYAVSFVTLSPMAQNKIAQFMEQRIGNPEIHVRAINGKFFLEGVANSEDEKAKAQIIAEAYAPDIVQDEATADKKIISRKAEFVINLITVRQKKNTPPKAKIIQAVVHYVELHKDYSKGFRFQWTPGIGDGSKIDFQSGRGPSGVVSTISGTISNLLPKLNWAKEHGHARILQSSSIIVESGKKGIVKSVSEIPYQTTTPTGQPTTSFKQVGITADITPQVSNRGDSIQLLLRFNVSALVGATQAGPITARQMVDTAVSVPNGQSAAVGGLISSSTGTDYNKLPSNVSKNPLVSLYASKSFRKKQSQFVVFVTPIIKTSASEGAQEIKRKFRLRN